MTVYFRYKSVSANAEEKFVLDLKREAVTHVGFFADNPSFEFECTPLFQRIPNAKAGEEGANVLTIESGFFIPCFYHSDNPLNFRVKEVGAVANKYIILIVTGQGGPFSSFAQPNPFTGVGGGNPF